MATSINIHTLADARLYEGRRVRLYCCRTGVRVLGSGVLQFYLTAGSYFLSVSDSAYVVRWRDKGGFLAAIELLDDESTADCVRGNLEEARSALEAEQANVKRLEAELASCEELDARNALAAKRYADNARWPLPSDWGWYWSESSHGDAMIANSVSSDLGGGCCEIRNDILTSYGAPLEVVKTVLARHQAELYEGLESWDLDHDFFLCQRVPGNSYGRAHTLVLGDRVRLEFADSRPSSVHCVSSVSYEGSVRVSPGFTFADYDTAKDAQLVCRSLGVTKITKLRPDK